MVSSVFGQYADQRLVQAATDPGSAQDIITRYDFTDASANDPSKRIAMDADGTYWIDYLADTGDGFDSTYTMAYLLALDGLRVNDADSKTRLKLTHGDILIMGGDQCYPQATREDYKKKLTTPFTWAYDVPQPERKLFAIPGNHDWYDGLAAFDSLFCSSRGDRLKANTGTTIGGWQCQQHRSYWALQLPHGWWMWGTDIQFSKFLDAAQVSYFEVMAAQMKPGDKLIICMAEPAWMLSDFGKQDEEENFFKITTIARQAGAKICAIIAGDWHHYARYYSPELDVHFFTAGGGGSFLHPTHVLKNEIKVEWPQQGEAQQPKSNGNYGPPVPGAWHKESVGIRLSKNTPLKAPGGAVAERVGEVLKEAVGPLDEALKGRKHQPRILKSSAPKCYPERGRSVLLSLRNLMFPFYNISFAMMIGLIYWLITWEFYAIVERHDISAGEIDAIGVHTSFWNVYRYLPFYLVQGLLVSIPLAGMLIALWGVLTWYVDAGERKKVRRFLRKFVIGTTHFTAHVATMFALGLMFVQINNWIAPPLTKYAETLWASTATDKPTAVGSVAKKVLEPLSQGRQQQREMFGQDGKAGSSNRRAAPPAVAMPDGVRPAAADNKLDPKAIRQLIGFVLYPLEIIVLGGIVGGFIWGLYWVLTSIFLRMHAEDAFAALRIKHYKNFLRFKFEKDQLTIYPIGVDTVPTSRFWTARKGAREVPSNNPQLIASGDINVRLIEPPIVIRADGIGA
jgi:hypothetical protein